MTDNKQCQIMQSSIFNQCTQVSVRKAHPQMLEMKRELKIWEVRMSSDEGAILENSCPLQQPKGLSNFPHYVDLKFCKFYLRATNMMCMYFKYVTWWALKTIHTHVSITPGSSLGSLPVHLYTHKQLLFWFLSPWIFITMFLNFI